MVWTYTVYDSRGRVFDSREFVTAANAEHCPTGSEWLHSWGPLYKYDGRIHSHA